MQGEVSFYCPDCGIEMINNSPIDIFVSKWNEMKGKYYDK